MTCVYASCLMPGPDVCICVLGVGTMATPILAENICFVSAGGAWQAGPSVERVSEGGSLSTWTGACKGQQGPRFVSGTAGGPARVQLLMIMERMENNVKADGDSWRGRVVQTDMQVYMYYDKAITATAVRAQAAILGVLLSTGGKPEAVKALLEAGARPMYPAVITAWLGTLDLEATDDRDLGRSALGWARAKCPRREMRLLIRGEKRSSQRKSQPEHSGSSRWLRCRGGRMRSRSCWPRIGRSRPELSRSATRSRRSRRQGSTARGARTRCGKSSRACSGS
jgi:hypothetical protein